LTPFNTQERFRGFCFLTFSNKSSIDAILEAKVITVRGRDVDVKETESKEKTREKLIEEKKKKAYLESLTPVLQKGKLSQFTQIDTLMKYLLEFGNVEECHFFRDKNATKSYGFVLFTKEDSLDRLLSKGENHMIGTEVLLVKPVKLKEDTSKLSSENNKKSTKEQAPQPTSINEFRLISPPLHQAYSTMSYLPYGYQSPVQYQGYQAVGQSFHTPHLGFPSSTIFAQTKIGAELDNDAKLKLELCKLLDDDEDQPTYKSYDNFGEKRLIATETRTTITRPSMAKRQQPKVAKSDFNRGVLELRDRQYEDIQKMLDCHQLDNASTIPKTGEDNKIGSRGDGTIKISNPSGGLSTMSKTQEIDVKHGFVAKGTLRNTVAFEVKESTLQSIRNAEDKNYLLTPNETAILSLGVTQRIDLDEISPSKRSTQWIMEIEEENESDKNTVRDEDDFGFKLL